MTLQQRLPKSYPESDGKPMAETDVHRDQMTDPLYALRWHFREQQDLYISANLLLLYDQFDRNKHVSPDLFAVRGVPRHRRRSYKIWEEPVPEVVIEITSPSTRREDFGHKRTLYAGFGVSEYYIFDPNAEYLNPPLRAYRLINGRYFRVIGPIFSRVLGLFLVVVQGTLRLASPEGELLPIPEEAYQGWERERQRADDAQRRADEEHKRADEAHKRAEEAVEISRGAHDQGIQEGLRLGKLEVARGLLAKGMAAETVAEVTGLSLSDLRATK